MSKSRNNLTPKDHFIRVGFPLLLAILLAFIVKHKIFTPLEVENSFMEPTFKKGDTVYINRFSRVKNLLVGDVILVKSPLQPEVYILARILGKAGDEIQITSREALRNGNPIPNAIFPNTKQSILPILPVGKSESDHHPKFTVPEKTLFLLADNREIGIDSRELGPIAEDLIVGKVW
jgi:signal peptidase I